MRCGDQLGDGEEIQHYCQGRSSRREHWYSVDFPGLLSKNESKSIPWNSIWIVKWKKRLSRSSGEWCMRRAFEDNNFLNKSLMLAFQHIISMGGRRDIHLLKGILPSSILRASLLLLWSHIVIVVFYEGESPLKTFLPNASCQLSGSWMFTYLVCLMMVFLRPQDIWFSSTDRINREVPSMFMISWSQSWVKRGGVRFFYVPSWK